MAIMRKAIIFLSIFLVNIAFYQTQCHGQCQKYSFINPFWKIITNPSSAPLIYHSFYSLAFPDKKMRVKSHFLLIPANPYTSFSQFIQEASPKEIIDIIRSISKVADLTNLSTTGYRVIANHGCDLSKPAQNVANQEVGHLHFHITGGECLGAPVSAIPHFDASKPFKKSIVQADQSILTSSSKTITLPFGATLTPEQFKIYVQTNRYKSATYTTSASLSTFTAFRVEHPLIQDYFGIVLMDENNNFKYDSLDDFSRHASPEDILNLIDFLKGFILSSSLQNTGYRLYSNSGADSWHNPPIFQIYIIGGVPLGPTVTNVYGNKDMTQGSDHFLYYSDLPTMPHEHCKKLLP